MPVTNYYTANGRLIGEATAGDRTDYLTDALGSVTAIVDQSQAVQNTYRFKPYGELLNKTGAAADPMFLWVGNLGYLFTALAIASHYVRYRHYSDVTATWITKDPVWPDTHTYGYANAIPVTVFDYWGLSPCQVQDRYKDNDCSKDKSLMGACIAMICSFGTVKEMYDDLDAGIGAVDKGLKDKYKYLKGIIGKKYSPVECCRDAHGKPVGPRLKCGIIIKIAFPPVVIPYCKIIPPTFAWIAQQICKSIIDSKHGNCFFVCHSRSNQECLSNCYYMSGVLREDCIRECNAATYTDDGWVEDTVCNCRRQGLNQRA
ncbi:MAG: hypothetical protein KF784_00055 [Fimbriimonadaceae bacterium]|nr:hypothetical protein [Fimbriimonadaceae bacterium]